MRRMTKRPWKVFVRDIGPAFTYSTADRAHRKAQELAEEYTSVLVYNVEEVPPRHTVYKHGREAVDEVLVGGRWVAS